MTWNILIRKISTDHQSNVKFINKSSRKMFCVECKEITSLNVRSLWNPIEKCVSGPKRAIKSVPIIKIMLSKSEQA